MRNGIAAVSVALLLAVANGAEAHPASVSPSKNALPNVGVSGAAYLCLSNSYDCTSGGYGAASARASGWPWIFYGAGFASTNASGPHNGTLYVAFRLQKVGVANPGWHADATDWATKANANGMQVDQTATVGAVAQWNRAPGHVAYVEAVGPTAITISGDHYDTVFRVVAGVPLKGGYTEWIIIQRNSPAYPDNFIHFKRAAGRHCPTCRRQGRRLPR